ncbi:MAG: SMC-Scp complex subunit ScpB [Planctomycetota bacterium]
MTPEEPNDDNDPSSDASDAAPLSIERLNAAFAQMLSTPAEGTSSGGAPGEGEATASDEPSTSAPERDPCEVSPASIVEAILFVGAEQGGGTAEQLASRMRDVTPDEVREAIAELNAGYERDGAAYRIEATPDGYQLALLPELHRMRDKFHGRLKEFQLTGAAMEVLALVAYKQPLTQASIDQMRGTPSGSLLAALVRRGLVRLDRGEEDGGTHHEPHYRTTDRFLRVFRIADPKQLPRVAEIDD